MSFQSNQLLFTASPLYKFNPSIKIFSTFIILFAAMLADSWTAMLILFFFTFVTTVYSRLSLIIVLKDLRALWLLLILTPIFHLFFGTGSVIIQLPFGFSIREDSLMRGAFYTVKIVILLVLITVSMRTTHSSQISQSLSIFGKLPGWFGKASARLAITLELALRFLPLLLSEAERIKRAQISRGANFSKSLKGKVSAARSLILPLLTANLSKVDTITAAMYSRGFRVSQKRSTYKHQPVNKFEIGVILSVISISIIALLLP